MGGTVDMVAVVDNVRYPYDLQLGYLLKHPLSLTNATRQSLQGHLLCFLSALGLARGSQSNKDQAARIDGLP